MAMWRVIAQYRRLNASCHTKRIRSIRINHAYFQSKEYYCEIYYFSIDNHDGENVFYFNVALKIVIYLIVRKS